MLTSDHPFGTFLGSVGVGGPADVEGQLRGVLGDDGVGVAMRGHAGGCVSRVRYPREVEELHRPEVRVRIPERIVEVKTRGLATDAPASLRRRECEVVRDHGDSLRGRLQPRYPLEGKLRG